MSIFTLLYVLFKIKLLTPLGIYRLINSVGKYGINIMTLLCFVQKSYGSKTALVDEDETICYDELFSQVKKLSVILKEKYRIQNGQKAGLICRNHASLVKAIFAVSALGVDIYLLNAEMSKSQFHRLLDCHDFDLLVYDYELDPLVKQLNYTKYKVLSYHNTLPAINNLLNASVDGELKAGMSSKSKIVLLTGGTTGNSKEAAHKPSIFNYLNPFLSLLKRLNLLKYNTAYIATPIYHGYGIAVLLLFTALGKKVIINRKFEAKMACDIINKHSVDVVTVVPLMIERMLKNNPKDLKSLQCIASGGAQLNPKLVNEVFSKLGDILYNLYGTSEAGLNMIATPQDLRYSAVTIGKKIKGVRLKILDDNMKEAEVGKAGQFCIKNKWSMRNSNNSWIKTGDIGYRDSSGYYYLCGRVDDMIVSAGENVYPIELEQIIINHPYVDDVAVVGVSDESFGYRLKAYVLLCKDAAINKEELLEWLRCRAARYQMPKEIVFVDNMPYTPLGKIDRKQLK